MSSAPDNATTTTATDNAAATSKIIGVRYKMRFKHKLMLILFSISMMVVLRTGFVFFVIGMLPCIVAYYMDVTRQRYTFQSVFASNLAGMMPFLSKLAFAGHSSALLQEMMGAFSTWLTIYGAAFIGWLLVKICPMAAQVMVAGVHQTQALRYGWLQKKLESEWGDEVRQFSGVIYHTDANEANKPKTTP